MDLSVVYSSKTGNTRKVAEAIAKAFGVEALDLATCPDVQSENIAIGYWVDKGHQDDLAREFMESLEGKRLFLFGTLGAEPDTEHAMKCMEAARNSVSERNVVLGEFICQGKIAPQLIEVFKKFPPDHPHAITPERLARYERAASHPDEADLGAAVAAAKEALEVKEA